MTIQTTTIWLIKDFHVNSGTEKVVAAAFTEENARECAKTLINNISYISLQSVEMVDG